MTDAPELLLAHHLKTLRLRTFLREHDKLARICAAEGVDHVRYPAQEPQHRVAGKAAPGRGLAIGIPGPTE